MHTATRGKSLIWLGCLCAILPVVVGPTLLWTIADRNNSPIQWDIASQAKAAAGTTNLWLLAVLAIGLLSVLFLVRRGVGSLPTISIVIAITTVFGWMTSAYSPAGPPGLVNGGEKSWRWAGRLGRRDFVAPR
ncbi:MAG: hypothetical protein AB8G99_12805 [Planctomycetaceae bacterium]